MSLFDLFKKKEILTFKIDTLLLDDSSKFDTETKDLVKTLSTDEFAVLHTICRSLQKHIDSLINFWENEGLSITKERMKSDKTVVYKSCFELLMMDWVLIAHEFKTKSIRREVGQILWFILYDSVIQSKPSIFNERTFPNFQLAFKDRTKVYEKLMIDLYSGESSHQLALQNLYVLFTQIPLKNDTSDIEKSSLHGIFINGMISLDAIGNMKKTSTFNRYFTRSFQGFSQSISEIVD
jgi:hypothetical protein